MHQWTQSLQVETSFNFIYHIFSEYLLIKTIHKQLGKVNLICFYLQFRFLA